MGLEAIIRQAREQGASDIHLEGGMPMALRVRGELKLSGEPVTALILERLPATVSLAGVAVLITALASGWQIATGIIEGAARFLIKDRMDITGARWSTPGAQAVLRLRALIANGDFDEYWQWHQQQELRRNHLDRYQELDLAA